MFTNYAFTLRKTNTKKPITGKDYMDHMYKIFDKNGLNVFDFQFEYESGMHVHGCVSVPILFEDQIYKLRVRGWRCHLLPIYDLGGWIAYYNKHVRTKADIDSVIPPLENINGSNNIDASEENVQAKEGIQEIP